MDMVVMAKKKRNSVRSFRLTNDTWQYVLFIRLGGTKEQAVEWFEKKFGEPAMFASGSDQPRLLGSCIYRDDEKSHLIWFADKSPGAGIVCHEALHSTAHALRASGLGPLTLENEEAYAYLQMWTVMQIARRVW